MGHDRRQRRGNTVIYLGLAMFVIGGFAAFSVEYAYLRHVDQQLEGVAAAASHAATVEMSRGDWTTDAARDAAVRVTEGSVVDNQPYTLDPEEVEFGYYTPETGFTATEEQAAVNAVRVQLVEENVGLGFGKAFLGRDHMVSTCAAVGYGDGNASTGDEGGPGLANGHFDYDTTDARWNCPGTTRCNHNTKHSHEYDDNHDVTYASQFAGLGSHLPVDGCTNDKDRPGTCDGVDYTRTIPPGQSFKIRVINAELSPGAWITINGVDYDVTAFDDTPTSDTSSYTIDTSGTQLTELQMNFDVNSIANCQLHPTNTSNVRRNDPGIEGEWRSGALTIQLVTPGAKVTAGNSAGDHDAVISQDDGLLYEASFFWHWSGASYTVGDAEQWQADYDALDCPEPEFLADAPGSSVCG